MAGLDPISLALSATQIGMGAFQSLFSGKNKARKEMEAIAANSPMYSGSKPINDYYTQALARYNENPYQSQQYQVAAKNAMRGTATGLNALGDRRSAIGGVGRLIGIQDQALDNAGVNAENQRNARFGQLAGATQMKNQDDLKKFDINQMSPYQRKLQLATMKTQAANARFDAGLSNIVGGTTTGAMLYNKPSTTNNTSVPPPAISVPKLPYNASITQDEIYAPIEPVAYQAPQYQYPDFSGMNLFKSKRTR
jgi:hypothetical protein